MDSLLEMDSPGFRFDGALVLQENPVSQQQGQVFLNELRLQEKKFEDNIAQLEVACKQQLQQLNVGMDNRDQEKNEERDSPRAEVKKQQALILKPDKLLCERRDRDDREQTMKKKRNRDHQRQDDTDDLYEHGKKTG